MSGETTADGLPLTERFAAEHPDQWRGCVACRASHHATAFCPVCGRCYFVAEYQHDDEFGTFVFCSCGHRDLWD